MGKKLYYKPKRVGWIMTWLGLAAGVGGFLLADQTSESGFFALMLIGFLLMVSGIVVLAVYGKLAGEASRAIYRDGALLKYTISADNYRLFSNAEATEIKTMNRSSLYIGLFFCAVIAIAGPVVVDDFNPLIAVLIGLFLLISQRVITGYRVKKLAHADHEVVLAENGAYVGGEFHLWDSPLTYLNEVQYLSSGEYEGYSGAVIRITYSAITRTLVTPYTFILPIPQHLESEAISATETLKNRIHAPQI